MYQYGVPYLGGKFGLLKKLLPIIEYVGYTERMEAFLDVCGGGGKLACSVAAGYNYPVVLYNDIDYGMASLIACMRKEQQVRQVVMMVDGMFDAEDGAAQYHRASALRKDVELTLEERAGYTLYCLLVSYGNSFRGYCENNRIKVAKHRGYHRYIKYSEHLQRLQVSCNSCIDILEKYKNESSYVSFIDPPYHSSEFKYENDWKSRDYTKLVHVIESNENKIILCGRKDDCKVYDCLLNDQHWHRISMGLVTKNCIDSGVQVEEFIWTNFEVPLSLQ